MARIEPPIWFNVNEDARIWSGHAASAQKQGWLIAPAAILAVDDYKGSYQFKEWKVVGELGGKDKMIIEAGYPQLWIRHEDVSLEPYDPNPTPDPVPGPVPVPIPGDEAAGAALRVLVTWAADIIRNLR